MINYESAAVPKIVEQCVIKLNNLGVLKFSSFVIFITLLYFVESSFLCRFRVESVNVFVLPPFDFCTSKIFFHQQTISYMQKRFPNEFTVRVNIEFFPGWKKIEQRRISFVLGYLRMILRKISTAIYLYAFLNQSLGLLSGNIFILK